MSEDRPLTEFAGDADDETEADDEPATDTEPATPAYRWQPEGATCENCGATTKRQWHDDDAFVCPDCKPW